MELNDEQKLEFLKFQTQMLDNTLESLMSLIAASNPLISSQIDSLFAQWNKQQDEAVEIIQSMEQTYKGE